MINVSPLKDSMSYWHDNADHFGISVVIFTSMQELLPFFESCLPLHFLPFEFWPLLASFIT